MNYNHSGARRGKPKRILDPSAGFPAPASPPNSYMYQQVPMNNGIQPDYGFNIPEQPSPAYGFNQQGMAPPMQPAMNTGSPMPPYPSETPQSSFPTPQFAANILAEPMVANMAMQYGDALVGSGKQHLQKYVPVSALKYYFAVDTDYVFLKLALLFFPFTHKDWSVKYEQDVPLQPRYEKNAPDMYIPTMAFLTYVVIAGLSLGTQERFTPEQLGIIASTALAWGIIELVVHTITLYVMNLDTSLRTLDMVAYGGYKYVGINLAILLSLIFGRVGYYGVLMYFSISLAFFLIRSLKLRVIPEGHSSYSATGNKRRLYFILFFAALQPLLMWWLSYHLIS
ncbi:GSCOCG00001557001-RA-CDS [Cotesia congregata]|uniref:Protein YIF1 n=1 Tax=Cotesia congregata TaxID=51543 RepID=A0A8J2HQ75_COTCN|nr:GSCOCG00001557001-RA-CDS [Cotesia congregata]CAG5106744.1 Similar to yif1b-a: Protein YIF1B-A (Xenopus laevis) [Cotesia congregata]